MLPAPAIHASDGTANAWPITLRQGPLTIRKRVRPQAYQQRELINPANFLTISRANIGDRRRALAHAPCVRVDYGFAHSHIRVAPKKRTGPWPALRLWIEATMPRVRFNKLIALPCSPVCAPGWRRGEFSSVGSAENEAGQAQARLSPAATGRTVAVVVAAARQAFPRHPDLRPDRGRQARHARDPRRGIISELPVKQGDHVKAGDLVLLLDAEERQPPSRCREGASTQRQAEGGGRAPGQGRQRAEAAARQCALRARRGASAAGDGARPNSRATRSRRPSTASSTACRSSLAASIMAGGEVATLIALDPILGKGEISERDLRYLKIGDEAEVRLVNGETVKGTVRYVSRDATASTRTFPVEVAIPNADRRIPAGMTAEITLRAEPADAVDPAALRRDAERQGRPRHPRRRQGPQGRVLPDRSGRRHAEGPGSRRHPGRRAHHRRRPGPGHRRRRGQAGRGRARRRSRS